MQSSLIKISQIKDQKTLAKVVSIFYLQDAHLPKIPYEMRRSHRLMFTILLSIVLQNYHLVFAICLSIQNSA